MEPAQISGSSVCNSFLSSSVLQILVLSVAVNYLLCFLYPRAGLHFSLLQLRSSPKRELGRVWSLPSVFLIQGSIPLQRSGSLRRAHARAGQRQGQTFLKSSFSAGFPVPGDRGLLELQLKTPVTFRSQKSRSRRQRGRALRNTYKDSGRKRREK